MGYGVGGLQEDSSAGKKRRLEGKRQTTGALAGAISATLPSTTLAVVGAAMEVGHYGERGQMPSLTQFNCVFHRGPCWA